MIKIHRIEATNVRALGHAVFEPLVDGGLTAVNGPNGAGKSSLLSALLWGLYGVTPDGVSVGAMRRQNSEGDCKVVIDFEHDGQVITVERGVKGHRDTTYMKVYVNGTEQAFGKIRACESWLIDRFGGLDAEGFMTAFVVRQKELDGLIKAPRAARRALIERLAGIDRMSTAVKTARAEESETSKRLDLLPGDPQAAQAARDALEVAQRAAIECWSAYEAAQVTEENAKRTFDDAHQAAAELQGRLNTHAAAKDALVHTTHALSMTRERVATATRDRTALERSAVGGTDADVAAAQQTYRAAQEAVAANKDARSGADRAVTDAERARAHAETLAQRAAAATAKATQARTVATAAEQAAAGFPETLDADIETAEQIVVASNEKRGALRGEHERLTASITAMQAAAGSACCPTCESALPDPTAVLTTLLTARDRVMAEGTSAKDAGDAAQNRLVALRAQASARVEAFNALTHTAAAAVSAEEIATETRAQADEAAQVAEQADQVAHAAKEEALAAARATQGLTDAEQVAGQALRAAQNAAEALAALPAALAHEATLKDAATTAQNALDAATQAEMAARVDADEQTRVTQTYAGAQHALNLAQQAVTKTDGDYRVAEEQARSAERVRDAEELRMRARAEAHEELERRTATREALDEFRRKRIADLAPELSEIATDLVAKMTDGKFVSMELDEEFTPVVTDNQGNRRPSSWLSGGEESAVAFALRLAIGEVIAGQQGGLLWMDEPQTAMDATRRPAMMSVVRELAGRQPIMISHVSEASDMADLVVEVVPDDTDGSTILTSAVTRDVDEVLLDALDA